MSFFENTRKPVGLGGKIMVAMMNFGHSAMAEWGLRFLQPAPDAMVLDCGCGGWSEHQNAVEAVPQRQGAGHRLFGCQRRKKRVRSMRVPLRLDGAPCSRQVWQSCRLKRSSLR